MSLFFIVLAVTLAGTTSIVSADGMPSLVNQFYGTITLNGNDAPAGTIVRAYVGDELRGSVEAGVLGKYGCEPDLNYLDVHGNEGETITFTVAGAQAAETIEWSAGSGGPYAPPRELDLSAEDHESPVVSAPNATPNPIAATGCQLSRLNVTATDNGDIYRVTVNLSTVGGPDAKVMHCIGGDIYSATTTVAEGIPNGTYLLRVTAIDFGGNYDESAVDVSLTVGNISCDWRNKWMGPDSEEGSTVTITELLDAVENYWLTDTPLAEYGSHVLTTEDIQELVAAWLSGGVPGGLSAVRDISEQTVVPGSTFTVTVTLTANGDVNVSAPALNEDLPDGWTVTENNSGGAYYKAFTSGWIWLAAMITGDSKTVVYDVTVPGNAEPQEYNITGSASAYDVAAVGIGGEGMVTVEANELCGDTNGDDKVDMDELFAAIDAYIADPTDMDLLFCVIDAYIATA